MVNIRWTLHKIGAKLIFSRHADNFCFQALLGNGERSFLFLCFTKRWKVWGRGY